MLVVMEPSASQKAVDNIVKKLEEVENLHVQIMPGAELTLIGAIGDASKVRDLGLEAYDGVDRVIPIGRAYKLASKELKETTSFEVLGKKVGRGYFTFIAGPCTVEDKETTLAAIDDVYQCGVSMARGGAFKPRTSPFAFQGLGVEALKILDEARQKTGLPIVSELTSADNAEVVAEYIDVIQIGARNMQNYALLEVVGKLNRPVLLKRSLSATLDELLQAADYILKGGQENVILCERGIRTFDQKTRFTLDISAVPWLQNHTHLPVIIDPSHAPGDRNLVPALSQAAVAVGADGIIVEATRNPSDALCDAAQQLESREFDSFATKIKDLAVFMGKKIS